MVFLAPSFLWLGLLALVPLALYLFRTRPRAARVSTLLFYRSLAQEHREAEWLRRLKRLLSLLLSLAVIAGATLALARPAGSVPEGGVKAVIALVDRSASMGARDGSGRTRLAVAQERLRERIARLGAGVPVSIVAYDSRAQVLVPRSLDAREIARAIAGLQPRPVEGDAARALRLARELAATETPAVIWHLTDAPEGEAEGALRGEISGGAALRLERIAVALPGGRGGARNAGITAFQVRSQPLDLGRYEAFIEARASGAEALEAELRSSIDGKVISLRRLTLQPGKPERLVVPIEAGEGKVIALRLSLTDSGKETPDALAGDDSVYARLPLRRSVRVLWISPTPDPFTELALSSLGESSGVRIFQGGPDAWPPKEPSDLVVFQNWLPEAWPEGTPAIVIQPPRALGPAAVAPLSEGLLAEHLRAPDPTHPLLFGVATARIVVQQTAVIAAQSGAGLEPVWIGPAGAVLAAGEVKGSRLVVFGFEPAKSESLPLLASYPLLIGNAIQWAVKSDRDETGGLRKTGTLLPPEVGSVTWSLPEGTAASEVTVAGGGRGIELDRVALYRTDGGEEGGAALLSPRETELPAAEEAAPETAAPESSAGDRTPMFLWMVLVALVVESYLFHRRSVY